MENLQDKLKFFEGVGDEFLQELKVVENDTLLSATVMRKIGANEKWQLIHLIRKSLTGLPLF